MSLHWEDFNKSLDFWYHSLLITVVNKVIYCLHGKELTNHPTWHMCIPFPKLFSVTSLQVENYCLEYLLWNTCCLWYCHIPKEPRATSLNPCLFYLWIVKQRSVNLEDFYILGGKFAFVFPHEIKPTFLNVTANALHRLRRTLLSSFLCPGQSQLLPIPWKHHWLCASVH